MYHCSMCSFYSVSFRKYTMHIVRLYRSEPNFLVTCCRNNCQYSTKSWNAFKMHVSRTHSREVAGAFGNEVEDTSFESELEDLHVDTEDTVLCDINKHINAKFLLALKVSHGISERGVAGIIQNTEELVVGHLISMKNKIKDKMAEHEYDTSVLDSIGTESVFEGLSTKDLQFKFFKEQCGLISSEPVYMGESLCKIRGAFKQRKKYGYIIPFLKNIEQLMSMPEVLFWVKNSHKTLDGISRDICDGSFMQNVSIGNGALHIEVVLYLDDIEIVNPIGTHVKKHKLTMFYFTLANIAPSFRSRYEAIQLLAIAKTVDVKKFGLKKLLSDFIAGINTLKTGIQMSVRGQKLTVYGSLVMVLGDTPAAQWIGGFKEGVGFANHGCRTCNASATTMKYQFLAKHFQERDQEEHENRCAQLSQLSKTSSVYWSRCWGINERSCLLDIAGFNLSVSLVHDPMHILNEGIVIKEICCMLYYFVELKKYFTLSWLNDSMSSYTYSYLEQKDKPETIKKKMIYLKESLNSHLPVS